MHASANRRRLWGLGIAIALLLGAALWLPSATACASAGERELWAGLGAGLDDRVSLEGRYLLNLDDFWALMGSLERRQGWPVDRGEIGALVGARLIIDALTWVPAITASVGGETRWPGALIRGVARLEGSLAWRPARDWAAVLRLGLRRPLEAQAESVLTLTVGLGWIHGGAASLDY